MPAKLFFDHASSSPAVGAGPLSRPPAAQINPGASDQPDPVHVRHRVFILDRDAASASALAALLNAQRDMICSGHAPSYTDARPALAGPEPSEAILLILRESCEMLAALLPLRTELPALRILVICPADEKVNAELAIHAGASGYIMQRDPSGELLVAIRSILKGEVYLSYDMSLRVIQRVIKSNSATPQSDQSRLDA